MQNVGAKQRDRIAAVVDSLVASGVYPSASRVAESLGRKPQKYKGDGLNSAENSFRREIMRKRNLCIRLGKT